MQLEWLDWHCAQGSGLGQRQHRTRSFQIAPHQCRRRGTSEPSPEGLENDAEMIPSAVGATLRLVAMRPDECLSAICFPPKTEDVNYTS
jgi:hypothetical protein